MQFQYSTFCETPIEDKKKPKKKKRTNTENEEENIKPAEQSEEAGTLSQNSKKIRKSDNAQHLNEFRLQALEKAKRYTQTNPLIPVVKNLEGKVRLSHTAFYKTRMCPLLQKNMCKDSESCNFAHTKEELREIPDLKKTKLCRLNAMRKCQAGKSCPFAHATNEIRSTPQFYRTSLCKAYILGNCKMGDSCRFAHGEEELQNPEGSKSLRYNIINLLDVYKEEQQVYPMRTPEVNHSDATKLEQSKCFSTLTKSDLSDSNGIFSFTSPKDNECMETETLNFNPLSRRFGQSEGAHSSIPQYGLFAPDQKWRNAL